MEPAIIYGIVGIAAFLLLYFRKDKSIDLKKTTTKRPVIKFKMYPIVKIADKQTQTDTPSSSTPPTPMSISSDSDFPFNFDEDYLNSGHLLSRKGVCVRSLIGGTTELLETAGITTEDGGEPSTRPLST